MAKDKTQREKFEDAARELGIDTDDDAFLAAVVRIANAPKLSDAEIKAVALEQREAAKR